MSLLLAGCDNYVKRLVCINVHFDFREGFFKFYDNFLSGFDRDFLGKINCCYHKILTGGIAGFYIGKTDILKRTFNQ